MTVHKVTNTQWHLLGFPSRVGTSRSHSIYLMHTTPLCCAQQTGMHRMDGSNCLVLQGLSKREGDIYTPGARPVGNALYAPLATPVRPVDDALLALLG